MWNLKNTAEVIGKGVINVLTFNMTFIFNLNGKVILV